MRVTLPVKCLDGQTAWVEVDQDRVFERAGVDGTESLYGFGSRWFELIVLMPGVSAEAKELSTEQALRWILEAGLPIPAELSELAERSRIR